MTKTTTVLFLFFYSADHSTTTSTPRKLLLFPQIPTESDIETLLLDGPSMGPYLVSKTNESLMNIDRGANPLYIVMPQFNQAQIGQNSYQHGTSQGLVLNTLTLTMSLNVPLQQFSTITVLGLTGSNTPSTGSLPVTSTNGSNPFATPRLGDSVTGVFSKEGLWTQSTGSLVFTCVSPVAKNTMIRVEFKVNNSFYAQESPTVYISGGVVVNPSSSSDEYVGRIPKTAMLAAPAELAPMFVQPAFTSKLIGQSTDAFLSLNLLSITISVNTPLAGGSIFIS
jgi:hypothetical protein